MDEAVGLPDMGNTCVVMKGNRIKESTQGLSRGLYLANSPCFPTTCGKAGPHGKQRPDAVILPSIILCLQGRTHMP